MKFIKEHYAEFILLAMLIFGLVGYVIGSRHGYWEATDDLCNGTQSIYNGQVVCTVQTQQLTNTNFNNMEVGVFELPMIQNDT